MGADLICYIALGPAQIDIDEAYVSLRLDAFIKDEDLSRYIL